MTYVRPGRPADELALCALQTHLRESSPELLKHGLQNGDVLVSLVSQTPVGYVLPVGGSSIHVAELVVHPDYRREGRGEELLQRLIDTTDDTVTLLVAHDNEPALALYRKLGFQLTGRRPGFYDDGDALTMARAPDGRSNRDQD